MMRNPNVSLYVYALLNITFKLNKDKHGPLIKDCPAACFLSLIHINLYARIIYNIQHHVNIRHIVVCFNLILQG